MIGDDPQRLVLGVSRPGDLRRRVDQGPEEVGLVVAVHPLKHRGRALQPHPGVHGGPGQRLHRAGSVAVELHEHEVPQLDVAVAVFVGAPRRPAGHLGPVVVEHLRAGAAGAGVAHRPEVVLLSAAGKPGPIDTDVVEPDPGRLVVALVHRHPQLLRREPEHAGQELPAVADRVALEVVAEAEVAEHLEEGVVARGVADVLQIVVLAAGAHAALRGGRPRVRAPFRAEEDVLELHHAGVGEQQGRIVAGHQRAARHDLVAALAEVFEKGPSELVALHRMTVRAGDRPAPPAAEGSRRRRRGTGHRCGRAPGEAGITTRPAAVRAPIVSVPP